MQEIPLKVEDFKRDICKPITKKPVFALFVKWKLVFESSLWVEMLQPSPSLTGS
jgi:hypothetical protein